MSKNIVFIPWIKDESRATRSLPYKYSIASWKQWCEKNDCDLVVMDEPICPVSEMKITWQRYYALDILDNSGIDYDQVLMVDADTIIHPDTPNFFEMTDGKFTAVHNEGCYDWICRSIENYHKHLFSDMKIPFGLNEYINTGFLIFNKSHKKGIFEHSPSYVKGSSQKVSEQRLLKKYQKVITKLNPGDVLVHHCLTVHGSYTNKSNEKRIGWTFAFKQKSAPYDLKKSKNFEKSLFGQIKKKEKDYIFQSRI